LAIELIHTHHGPRIHVPLDLRRRCGRKQIIMPREAEEETQVAAPEESTYTRYNHDALLAALARAFRWKKLLDEGTYPSVAAMAKALGISRYHMARMLRLTLLAPDIVESIVDGREHDGMSIQKLRKTMPMLWSEQLATLRTACAGGAEEARTAASRQRHVLS
jgi:hypothetical protein